MQGEERVGPLSRDTTFKLTCSGPGGASVAMIDVVLQRATLRWHAPASDASDPATQGVAGFRLEWGNVSGNYNRVVDVLDLHTRMSVVDLPGPGQYFFAMSALDPEGNAMARSNEATKVIPH